jgi:hypothetical protein
MALSSPSRRLRQWHLALMACLALLTAPPAWALDHITLQLKWKHQFQFAGYYAALEKAFYRDAGLDVELREGGPDVDAAKAMAAGQADFGVCTSAVLLDRANGRDLVVLAVIFQHSAAIILVPRRAGIATVSELKGRRLMDTPGSEDIAAMLKREGVDYASLPRVPHNGDPRDLLAGKADAMVAYSTNEPFILDRLGAPYQTFSPRAYASTLDMRTLPGYQAAKESGTLVVTEPSVNPDTGYPVISVRYPIERDGEFIGIASANITLDILSRFLLDHRTSVHSTTSIADPSNGMIIADSDRQKSVRMVDGRLEVAKLDNIADDDVREAYRLHIQTNRNDFLFRSSLTGAELSASFTPVPESFPNDPVATVMLRALSRTLQPEMSGQAIDE